MHSVYAVKIKTGRFADNGEWIMKVISSVTVRQFFVFCVVGVIATLTHYLVALFFHELLAVNLYVCNLIGYVTAVVVSYCGHSRFTFRVALSQEIFRRFIIVSILTFIASEGILAVLENTLQLGHRISLAIVVLIIPLITFLLNKMWVFRHSAH